MAGFLSCQAVKVLNAETVREILPYDEWDGVLQDLFRP